MLEMSEPQKKGGMYVDLAEGLKNGGHDVTVIAPDNYYKSTYLRDERGLKVLRVKCRKTLGESNLIKKGIGLALMPRYYKIAYNRYLKKKNFDWIFMPTPPITLIDFVEHVMANTRAKFYLILRDIHPHSIQSIGLIKYKFMYDYLEKRAKKAYKLATLIGCMSPGNIQFVHKHYPNIPQHKFVLLYNWLKREKSSKIDIDTLKEKYGLRKKIIVLFGGTIGLGQRIENIIFLANYFKDNDDIRFLVIGKGVEKNRLIQLAKVRNLNNIIFLDFMPQDEYLAFMSKSDIGLISINENYKVPTCPSKAVAYMSLGIPIFAIINPDNDYKNFIVDSGAGFAIDGFEKQTGVHLLDEMIKSKELRMKMSLAGKKFYEENLTVERAVNIINSQIVHIYE